MKKVVEKEEQGSDVDEYRPNSKEKRREVNGRDKSTKGAKVKFLIEATRVVKSENPSIRSLSHLTRDEEKDSSSWQL